MYVLLSLQAKLTTLTGTCTNGKSELLIGYNCKSLKSIYPCSVIQENYVTCV